MAKGRRNHGYKHGGCAGWTEYRYGPSNHAPVTLAGRTAKPVMTKEKRRHVVHRVIDLMGHCSQSPFEYEGAIRHGLRSGLCLEGHGWGRSDAEAAEILSQAFRETGASRPTWEQGQRQYTDPRENCKWCYGPIAQEDMTSGRSRLFCSDVCARSAYVHWDMKNALQGSAIEREAYRAVLRGRRPRRACEECGKQFAPAREKSDQRFCSLRCFSAQRKRDVTERPCQKCGTMFTPSASNLEAKFCGKKCADADKRIFQPVPCMVCEATFIPKRADQRCCSQSCARQSLAFREVDRICECCGTAYKAKRVDSQYCSKACHRFAYRVHIGRIKRISSPVLDYLFRQQGLRITSEAS